MVITLVGPFVLSSVRLFVCLSVLKYPRDGSLVFFLKFTSVEGNHRFCPSFCPRLRDVIYDVTGMSGMLHDVTEMPGMSHDVTEITAMYSDV